MLTQKKRENACDIEKLLGTGVIKYVRHFLCNRFYTPAPALHPWPRFGRVITWLIFQRRSKYSTFVLLNNKLQMALPPSHRILKEQYPLL